MSDDPVRTRLDTDGGWLDFQPYFVRRRCEPVVRAIAFAGAEAATPSPAARAALADPALEAIVICPSNPLISVEPILALPGMRAALLGAGVPIVAVSPLIAVGHVAAVVQTYLRPPYVSELHSAMADMRVPRMWWSNRLLRIFLVFFLSNLGGSIGTLVGGAEILSNLAG